MENRIATWSVFGLNLFMKKIYDNRDIDKQ